MSKQKIEILSIEPEPSKTKKEPRIDDDDLKLCKPKSRKQIIEDHKKRGDYEWLSRNTASGLKAVTDKDGHFLYRVPIDIRKKEPDAPLLTLQKPEK